MQQRFIKPAFFILLFLAVVFLALSTGRGSSLLESGYHMGRFADYSATMPAVSSLLMTGLALPALLCFLVPDAQAIVIMVSLMGFWPGLIASTLILVLGGGIACAITKMLTHGAMRRWMAARRARGRIYARRGSLATEYCLLITALLFLFSAPTVLVGMLLGLCGMRVKAFCLAAFPWLAGRVAMTGLGVSPASFLELIILAFFGTIVIVVYLLWVRDLFSRRMTADSLDGPSVLPVRGRRNTHAAEPVQVEKLTKDASPNVRVPEPRALGSALVVCVRDDDEREVASIVMEEARAAGCRVIACRLNPEARPADQLAGAGFAERQEVVDLDELFSRGFGEGAKYVLAVRAITPFLRREQFKEAVQSLSAGCGLVFGTCEDVSYLIGIAQKNNGRSYEPGQLQGCDFTADVAFLLAGLSPRPRRLTPLPPDTSLRPYLSIFILSDGPRSTIRATLRVCLRHPWTECVVLVKNPNSPEANEIRKYGARVLAIEAAAADGLNRAVAGTTGRCLLFLRDGVLLPRDFDQAVWFTLCQEKCRVGGFSLPLVVPSVRRTIRWLGTAVHPGAFSGPGLSQGVFLSRCDFETFGGIKGPDIAEALAALVERAGQSGRVILHNARVRFLDSAVDETRETEGSGTASSGSGGIAWILAQARGLFTGKLGTGLFGRSRGNDPTDERAAVLDRLKQEASTMVASCDHCGRCTHVSPMLHSHDIDLRELAAHPLLAWHCFMCGACTSVCGKGIDAIALARLLRRVHVTAHGDRLSRPGHARTLMLAKLVPFYTRRARPGINLLLEPDFLAAFPRTAAEMARRLWNAGMGVIVADSGARLADLGMDKAARAMVERLRRTVQDKGVTGLCITSPVTLRWLMATNISSEPVLAQAESLGLAPLDMTGKKLLVPCADRERKIFLKTLAPWLRGEVSELEAPCCGAGGEAAVLEPGGASRLRKIIGEEAGSDIVLTSCAACARSLVSAGIAAEYDVAALMGVKEQAVTGPAQIRAVINSMSAISALGGKKEERMLSPLPDGEEKNRFTPWLRPVRLIRKRNKAVQTVAYEEKPSAEDAVSAEESVPSAVVDSVQVASSSRDGDSAGVKPALQDAAACPGAAPAAQATASEIRDEGTGQASDKSDEMSAANVSEDMVSTIGGTDKADGGRAEAFLRETGSAQTPADGESGSLNDDAAADNGAAGSAPAKSSALSGQTAASSRDGTGNEDVPLAEKAEQGPVDNEQSGSLARIPMDDEEPFVMSSDEDDLDTLSATEKMRAILGEDIAGECRGTSGTSR